MILHCLMMIRNEADIIAAMTNHALELFDSIAIVDICSTDGTFEILTELAQRDGRLTVYTCRTQERYQAAMMNRLAREAVRQGAHWVFFLDGDEFINIDGRDELRTYLRAFSGDVMHMPWINLIPTEYGTFETFDLDQAFHWSGRVSPFRKVAVSSQYMTIYPDFEIEEGNHNVARSIGVPAERENLGLGLLHVPVRSLGRLKYKLAHGIRLLASKHNAHTGEGNHAQRILDAIAEGGSRSGILNHIAGNYGSNDGNPTELDPSVLHWPSRTLPAYLLKSVPFAYVGKSLAEVAAADDDMDWQDSSFVAGAAVCAQVDGDKVVIAALPIRGSGAPVRRSFAALPDPNLAIAAEIDLKLLSEMANASFLKIDVMRFSAWSKLIPLLYAMFALARPRRYVELGVHNGMSFFAACQVAKHLAIETECVAVDSWVGDAHASFHSNEVFETFRDTIGKLYPDQAYIRGMFQDALRSFEDKSVDLLHIDGYHTYEAVKDDFETWLPKMSDDGIVIFHDINVHERGFGVWRYWEELKQRYPGFGFMHSHGLGVLYVGNRRSAASKMLEVLLGNFEARIFVQQYFEVLGQLSVEHREAEEGGADQSRALAEKDAKILEFQGYLAHRDAIIANLQAAGRGSGGSKAAADLLAQRDTFLSQRDDILAKLDNTARPNANGALLANDPALRAARDANRPPTGKGLLGKLTAKRDRKRWKRGVLAIANTIADSGLFDTRFYLDTYPDVRESGADPVLHYVEHGAFELRDPSAQFSSGGYLQQNRDVLKAAINPLFHYIEHGKSEGRHC